MNGHTSLGFIAAAVLAGCNAAGATAIPTTAPTVTAAPAATGPTAFATTLFSVPFSLTLPAGWKVGQEEPDMFAAYISTDHTTLDAGVDIQLVPKVYQDICNRDAGTTSGGATPAELAAWMLALSPLKATAGAPATIDGSQAVVVDESFAGTPCVNGELWPTSGGWLDASERKQYYLFEVGGKRFVATIVSSDAKFDAELSAGLQVLGSLHFTR